MNLLHISSRTRQKLSDSAKLTTWLYVKWRFTSNGWLVNACRLFILKCKFAEQLVFLLCIECDCFIQGSLYFFLTLLLWMQCYNSRKITWLPLISYPFICGIVIFEYFSKAENYILILSAVETLISTSTLNCCISKFSSVWYSGNLVIR